MSTFEKKSLLAPNGKPSNLTAEQYKLVRTPAFKKWFGDWENDPENSSKVVDDNGEPLVVYHGTSENFSIFDKNKISKQTEADLSYLGFFFTDSKKVAIGFTKENFFEKKKRKGAKVLECFLNIRKIKRYTIYQIIQSSLSKNEILKEKNILLKNKFDGVVIDKAEDDWEIELKEFDGQQFICFEPNQIKLSDGSNTTFDSSNPDIRYKEGGRTIAQTPAPKKDRIYGSKVNKEGSASSEKSAKSIKLSSDIMDSLSKKLKEFKENHKSDKVSLNDLKAVYRRGLGAYSSSHRPTISGGKPNTRNAWAMARVNAFLRKAGGGEHKKAYVQDDDLMKYADGGEVDDCINYIKYNQTIFENGYYFDMNDLSKVIDPYGQVPLNLDFTLVSYNSGGQNNLDVIDTINPTILVDKLSELLDLAKNQSYVVVHYVIDKAKRLTNIQQIKTEKIVIVDRDKIICENLNNLKDGGEVEDKKKTYEKWKSLVNMSSSELKKFYESEDGKKAGLSSSEAKQQGIDSGRESARWIMKMKQTPKSKWTPEMWRWAKKQISFISRMSGVKGDLYKPNGEKTRKHLALLIWGHNPKKYDMGGNIISLPDTSSEFERLKDILDQQGYVLSKKDAHLLKVAPSLEQIEQKHGVNRQYLEEQLQMGIKEEMEHTDNPEVAQTIALHHLYEDYSYYTHLEEMMQKAKEEEEYERGIEEIIETKSMKKGGEIDPDNKQIKEAMTHKSGSAGGLLVGNRHSEGGIKAVNKSTDQPLEMEGGEVVITRNAVSDEKKREFDGEMLTNREILSKINKSGGGVSFDKGGKVEDEDCGCEHYDEGGQTEIMMFGIQYPELTPSEMLDKIYDDNCYTYEEGGLIRLVHKKVYSLKDFISKNLNIDPLAHKRAYKDYLYNIHHIVFDELPQQMKMGLLLGNQKLIDKYINS
jgi:hypothetical protein